MSLAGFECAAIVPVYNGAKYIKDCIDSLLQQTTPFTEIIIVDDCSTDDTLALVKNLYQAQIASGHIILHALQQNGGVSNARNEGVRLTSAAWLLFMDADDLALPLMLERLLQRVQQLHTVVEQPFSICHAAYELIDDAGTVISEPFRWKQVDFAETLGYIFVRNHIISASGTFVERTMFTRHGGFKTNFSYSEDVELWTRIAHESGIGYVDEVLVQIRRHTMNASRHLNVMLEAERRVLGLYPLSHIQNAIAKRNLPEAVNNADFVSVLYRVEKWEEGFEHINRLLMQNEVHPTYFFLRGLYFLHVERFAPAQLDFAECVRLNPSHGAALNNLAVLLQANGETARAANYFADAIQRFPNYMDATHNAKLVRDGVFQLEDARFTWRELRPVLTNYVS